VLLPLPAWDFAVLVPLWQETKAEVASKRKANETRPAHLKKIMAFPYG
jgi:hypothetical protein